MSFATLALTLPLLLAAPATPPATQPTTQAAPADAALTPAEARQALVGLLKRPEMAEAVRDMPSPEAMNEAGTRSTSRPTTWPTGVEKSPEVVAEAMIASMPSLVAEASERPGFPKSARAEIPTDVDERIKAIEVGLADFTMVRWPVEDEMGRLYRAGKLSAAERELYVRTLAVRVDQLIKAISL